MHYFLGALRVKYHHLHTRKYKNINGVEIVVCLMNGIEEKDVDNTRQSIFMKTKRNLEILPPTNYALSLHIKRKTVMLSRPCNNESRK